MWLILLMFPLFLAARDIPYLDPNDPQFHWMDELIEKDFANLRRFTLKEIKDADWRGSPTDISWPKKNGVIQKRIGSCTLEGGFVFFPCNFPS